jgi:hypothetical protein
VQSSIGRTRRAARAAYEGSHAATAASRPPARAARRRRARATPRTATTDARSGEAGLFEMAQPLLDHDILADDASGERLGEVDARLPFREVAALEGRRPVHGSVRRPRDGERAETRHRSKNANVIGSHGYCQAHFRDGSYLSESAVPSISESASMAAMGRPRFERADRLRLPLRSSMRAPPRPRNGCPLHASTLFPSTSGTLQIDRRSADVHVPQMAHVSDRSARLRPHKLGGKK